MKRRSIMMREKWRDPAYRQRTLAMLADARQRSNGRPSRKKKGRRSDPEVK